MRDGTGNPVIRSQSLSRTPLPANRLKPSVSLGQPMCQPSMVGRSDSSEGLSLHPNYVVFTREVVYPFYSVPLAEARTRVNRKRLVSLLNFVIFKPTPLRQNLSEQICAIAGANYPHHLIGLEEVLGHNIPSAHQTFPARRPAVAIRKRAVEL